MEYLRRIYPKYWGNLSRRLRIMAGYYACAGFVMWYAVEKVFELRSLHLNATQIVSLVSLAYLVQLVLDVPSSILADRWSRSKLLALSLVSAWVAALSGALSSNYLTYSLVAIFWAFASSFHTGVSDALLYDVCEDEGQSSVYPQIAVQMQNIFRLAIALGLVLGGLVAAVAGLRAPYFGTLVFLLPMAVVVWRMHEPTFHKASQKPNSYKHILQSARNIARSRYILIIAALIVLADGIMAAGLYEFAQLAYVQAGIPVALIGLAAAFSNTLLIVMLTYFVVRLQRQAGLLLASVFGLAAVSLLILNIVTNRLLVVVFYAIAVAFMQSTSRWLSIAMQNNVPSAERASSHSLVTTTGSISWLIISPFMAIALAEGGGFGPAGVVAYTMLIASLISLLALGFGRKRFHSLFVS